MFRGRFSHTIDAKGRVSIPSGFRLELQTRSEQPPIVTNGMTNAGPCLWLYPYDDWCEFETRIHKHAAVDLDAQAYERFMVGGCNPCPIDGQGRILLPALMRDYAHLEHDVMIAGVGTRIELWNQSMFEEGHAKTQADFQRIAAVVAKLDSGGSG